MYDPESHIIEKLYSLHDNEHLKVVLHYNHSDVHPYVTHLLNLETKGYCHGNYFASLEDAIADFNSRGMLKTDYVKERVTNDTKGVRS